MIFFVITILVSTFLAYIADKKENLSLMLLCGLFLSLFSGLRSSSVGIDTAGYYTDFTLIKTGGYVFSKDFGWLFICRQLVRVLEKPEYIILLIAVITNVLIIARLWDFRKDASFTLMVLVYISVFYLQSLNIARQYLSVAIVFYGVRYLEKNRKNILFFISVFIATAIHTTSIIAVGIYFVKMIIESEHDRKVRNRLVFFAVFYIAVAAYIFSEVIGRYQHYFQLRIQDFGLMIPFQLFCVLLPLITTRFSFKNKFIKSKNGDLISLNKEYCALFVVGILFSLIGMYIRYIERVGIIFQLYQMPFWGQIVSSRSNKWLYRFLAIVFISYYIIAQFIYNGQRVFPYTTFWMN